MTNSEWIRNMSDESLAVFINYERPSCNEVCEDAKFGCALNCQHDQGNEVLLKWLKEDIG